ncbi:MAG: PAS domain S-box protein [Pedobacter sp.]|nr:MAG: PAS domain S-box protein [Pedobacter sp.]
MTVSLTFYQELIAEMRRKEQDLLKAKEQLESSERRFKALIEHGSDITSVTDENGNYKFVSNSAKRILGLTPNDIVGRSALEFIHPDDRARVHAEMLRLYEVKRVDIEPFRYITADESYIWLCTTATNLLDDPAVQGIITNSRDVTSYKESLCKINEQNLKLKDIAWTQSHEVRTFIARIISLVELLKQETLTPEQQELCQYISSSTNDLDKAVREIVNNAAF